MILLREVRSFLFAYKEPPFCERPDFPKQRSGKRKTAVFWWNMDKEIAERFWAKVEKTEYCWNWIGGTSSAGYGRFRIGDKLYSPHRLSFEWHNEPIPDGMLICHRCDNPSCVRPSHLFLGTYSDNLIDAIHKDINPIRRGEDAGTSVLTEEEVKRIRMEYRFGVFGYKRLAIKYGVGRTTIEHIIRRRTWKHI